MKAGRCLIAVGLCAAVSLVPAAPASAGPLGRVVAKKTGHVNSILDAVLLRSPWIRRPKRGSFHVKITAKRDKVDGYGDLVYASGLMQCYKRGTLYEAGRTLDHLNPPVLSGTGGFPPGARRNPRRCRVQVSSNFDPDSPPVFPAPWPSGFITIKIFHKR